MPKTKTTPKTSPAESPAEQKPEPPPVEFSRTHEMIIDAVAEMLTHGGHRDDVDSLIFSTMGWRLRRTYTGLQVSDKDVDLKVSDFIHEDLETWKTDLMIGWRKNQRADTPAFEAKTITERVRANVRDALQDGFDNFLRRGSPEEIRLLKDVLDTYESSSLPPEVRRDEVYLAEAFNYVIDNDATFVKVPRSMIKQVQKYVDALRAVEGKAA